MTDDFLADFERELHAAAGRRRARRAPRRAFRWAGPAVTAAAALAAVFVVLTLADAPEREVEVPAAPPAASILPPQLVQSECDSARETTVEPPARMGIFQRTQHAPDAPGRDQLRMLPAADFDGRATRAPTGIGPRVLLSPTSAVGCGGTGDPGVCVVNGQASRCFTAGDVEAGRAVALLEPGAVIGLVPDGVESVVLETAGARAEATVVENAFLAQMPRVDEETPLQVTLRAPQEGCAPSAQLRAAAPVLDRAPVSGGVPPEVRRAFGADSAVVGRHARIAGGGDGITYWVVPRLRCDVPRADSDTVCVFPRFEDDRAETVGGGACGTPADVQAGRTWLTFPLRGGGRGITGFAPAGATEARLMKDGRVDQRFVVEHGMWAGSLAAEGDVEVEFGVPAAKSPAVSVLNGTTVTGLARNVMDALEAVNYGRGTIGDWREHDLAHTLVYEAPEHRTGERIAIYLAEKFGIPRPEVRQMTAEARELGGEDAGAVVVAGRDLQR